MSTTSPSEAELEILQILWEHQPCTVKTVHEIISQKKTIGYTTALKQMQRMLEKGLVEREAGKGKSHVYKSALPKEETRSNLFDRLVENAFGNSVSKLVMHALGKSKPSKEELDEIKKFLDELD